MNERFVTSLDLSKKLGEAGVPQTSEFCWYASPDKVLRFAVYPANVWENTDAVNRFSAWTSGELGEMLPNGTIHWKSWNVFEPWVTAGQSDYDAENHQYFWGKTEAESKGAYLLHLLTSGLLKAEALSGENKGDMIL